MRAYTNRERGSVRKKERYIYMYRNTRNKEGGWWSWPPLWGYWWLWLQKLFSGFNRRGVREHYEVPCRKRIILAAPA